MAATPSYRQVPRGGRRHDGAGNGDDEAVHVRLSLSALLFGDFELKHWQEHVRRMPAALVLDCRGVYDALARSASARLGLADKKSGLEALALKQSLQK